MKNIRGRKSEPLGRYGHLPPRARITAAWYANHPDHYAGDASAATATKGRKLLALMVDSLAEYIRAVKKDQAVLRVLHEFYDRCDKVSPKH
jgi:creatinine amidohydrolase/Fe(II)-dependent formamide hydrolase-like protein